MSEKQIYFQWQNEALLKSIYPLRTMNLRNALEYYQEIDLWRQFKGKSVADMPDEVAAYHEKMSAVVKQAEKDYEFQLNYFCEAAFQLETVPGVDENLFKKIQTLHDSFKKYYRTYEGDAFRQSYFITRRLEALDADRKELDKRVSGQLRYVNMLKAVAIPNEAKIKAQTEVLDKLRALQPVFTEQREHLVALLSAFGKLEAHKKDYNKRKKIAEQQKNKIDADLVPLQSKLESLEAKLKDVFDDVRRLARQLQPETDLVDNYFAVPDLVTNMTDRFPQTDPVFCAQVDVMREEIALLHSDEVKRARLNNHISTLQRSRALFAKRTDLTFKENTLKAFDEVLDQMKEYWFKLDNQGKTNDILEKALKEKEQEGKKLEETFIQIKKTANELVAKFDDPELSILQAHEDLYIPIAPAMKDIIQLKLDEYIESTLKVKVKDKDGFKYQDKDQYQLLELLIERFKKEPARFPRWLQYMIVHFSGMRYASAHGSWADPRDLYLNLRISIINDELDKRNMDDFAVQEMCQKKIAEYTGEPGPDTVSGYELPKFAATEDKESKKKIQSNLTLLKKADAYSRRIGLLQLLLDEEAYENEIMTEQEALEALETLKEEGHIPEWMWKELSAVTDLRLSEARDENWEKLTPEEQALKNDAKWSKYRGIMNDWKKNNLTGWREEHDRTNDLLVSRAVCNEVAEHILHLRGHKGFAGLSGAADWFLNEAKKADAVKKTDVAKTSDVAYFVKPQGAEDYRPGAGILWLRYRYDAPPPWNTVNPFAPNKGQSAEKDEFFPSKYFNSGNWNYTTKSGLFRSRSVTDDKGKSTKIGQYLYWVHIATVAEVVEVDSGETIVLTYETNLPYEDRRLACVGVFRRSLHNLLYDGGEEMFNGSLVGYVPENPPDIPTADLDEMLDWDHILLK